MNRKARKKALSFGVSIIMIAIIVWTQTIGFGTERAAANEAAEESFEGKTEEDTEEAGTEVMPSETETENLTVAEIQEEEEAVSAVQIEEEETKAVTTEETEAVMIEETQETFEDAEETSEMKEEFELDEPTDLKPDFSGAIEEEKYFPDRNFDYDSYDAFAEGLIGVSLQRTNESIQFFNTYVAQENIQAGITTIDGLLDSNADWYSNDYILSLNPYQFKETAPVYRGSDGFYYVVSAVPTLNGTEAADYQPATNFYNDVLAEAFTDIEYVGNGVYRIPESRYRYCFIEQYYSDAGALYGVRYGLRIQVLYGYDPSEASFTVTADVVYPDLTEHFLPVTLDLLSGTGTVKIFSDSYDDILDPYCVTAVVNRGQSMPESLAITGNGKSLQFVMGDNRAVGVIDILIGYNVASKQSMAADTSTVALYNAGPLDNGIVMTAGLYNGNYVKLAPDSVPADLAVGDKFVFQNVRLTITGVTDAADESGTIHIGASSIPTHDAQSFALYSAGNAEQCSAIRSWFANSLMDSASADTDAAAPGTMVQMTVENMNKRAAGNGSSINLGYQKIFGYLSEGLGAVTSESKKTLNLEGTQVLLSCMHAWHAESTTPAEVVNSVNTFAERFAAQSVYAEDVGYGNMYPNLALQCTSVTDGGDGYTYVTFKVVSSMLSVRGINNPQNYQCAFSTLRIAYPHPVNGYLKVQKASSDAAVSGNNKCYNFEGIQYTVYIDSSCTKAAVDTLGNPAVMTLGADGASGSIQLAKGDYYIKETYNPAGSGFSVSGMASKVTIPSDKTVTVPVQDVPLADSFGIVILKTDSGKDTGADLSGAEYTIRYYAGQYTTETLPAEASTTWVIKTTKHSDGSYCASLNDECIVSGSADYGKSEEGAYIIPLGTVTIQETKAPLGFKLDGASVSNARTNEIMTGNDGVYLFNLADENSAVYIKSVNGLSLDVSDEAAVTFRWAESRKNGRLRLKKTGKDVSGNQTALAGAVFGVYISKETAEAGTMDNQSTAAAVITTGANGMAETSELLAGSYWVKELQAPEGYQLDSTVYGPFEVGMQNTLINVPVKENVLKRGILSIEKTDALTGNLLSGAQYTVYSDEDCTSEAGIIAVIDGKGQIELEYGTYYVKETGVPAGYQTDHTVYGPFIVGGAKGDIAIPQIKEEEQKIEIRFQKQDKETGLPQGDATLAGAVFELRAAEDIIHPDGTTGIVYHAGDVVATLMTDEGGAASTQKDDRGDWLHCGKYELVEVKAPAGYLLDQTAYAVDASYDAVRTDAEYVSYDAGVIADQIIRQPVVLHKITGEHTSTAQELSGIGFRFYLLQDVLEANGAKHFDELPMTSDGLDLDKVILDGLEQVIGENGETELFSDLHGKVRTIPLVYGEYLVVESGPNPYYEAGAPFTVLVPTVQSRNENGNDTEIHDIDYEPEHSFELQVINRPAKAFLTIEKRDSETGRLIKQADVAFQIFDAEGKLVIQHYWDGTKEAEADTFFTNKDGCLRTYEPLNGGEYDLVEIDGPEGFVSGSKLHISIMTEKIIYVENGVEYPCRISYTDAGEVIAEVPMKNSPITVEVSKSDITDGKEVPGAVLTVYEANKDGSKGRIAVFRDENGNDCPATWTTDGTKHMIKRIPAGNYILEETKAPTEEGYVRTEDVSFTVRETGEIQKVEMKDDYTKVELLKTDAETGKPVVGVLLSLTDASGKVIAEWTTDGNPYRFDRLPVGAYTLTEVRAPYEQGYATADPVVFEVAETGKLVTVEMIDRKTTVLISKQDVTTEKELPGAAITVTDKGSGKVVEQFVSGETPHQISGLVSGHTYILTEVTPPDGYQRTSAIEFTVTDTEKPQKIVMYDAALPPDVNHPKTPDIPPSIPVILGIEDYGMTVGILILTVGIIAAAAAFVLIKKRKDEKR